MDGKKVFLFAGEPSGDLYGARLVSTLKESNPRWKIYGVGGPKMRAAGLEPVLEMEGFQVMGFTDVALALPRLFKHYSFLKKSLLRDPPDVVIFIDYPGFNLKLASHLAKRNFPGKICQYVCPSVWAWGKKRIPKMEKCLDHLFVILPFESHLFNPNRLPVTFVGHPLASSLFPTKSSPLNLTKEGKVIALFPGSRERELANNFPIQLRVAKRLLRRDPALQFVVSVAEPSFSPLLEQMVKEEGLTDKERFFFVNGTQNLSLMKKAHLAIAKSGTNNLELALQKVPTVVTYGIRPIDLFIAKHIARVNLPYYCLVNIISNEEIFPELIGPNLTEEKLYQAVLPLLESEVAREKCREKCDKLGTLLGTKLPEEEILSVIKNFL